MPPKDAPALRALFWLVLGAWLGAAVLFVGAVAPAAFAAAPPPIAGGFIGRVLPAVHWGGVAFGLAALALLRARGVAGPASVTLAVGVALLCASSQLAVSPAIERLRPAIRAGDPDPAVRSRFGMLHGLSVGLLGGSMLSAIALAALQLRSDARRSD